MQLGEDVIVIVMGFDGMCSGIGEGSGRGRSERASERVT